MGHRQNGVSRPQGRQAQAHGRRWRRYLKVGLDFAPAACAKGRDPKAVSLRWTKCAGALFRKKRTWGPQVIKSEDTFLTSYVLFDKVGDAAPLCIN